MNFLSKQFFVAAAAIALATGAAAQETVVIGTGNPDVDVPAVQAAVDQGGEIILKGHFSFNTAPTVPTSQGRLATVLVSKAVTISGTQDGEMTSIDGGTSPFYVEAPRAPVSIRRLRFIRPKHEAIFVSAVSGLVIASCKIEGLEPLSGTGHGILINTVTTPAVPNPTNPGKPENISGTLLIANNDIDAVGGTVLDNTLGITIFSVGVTGAEVEVYVSGNKIRNTHEPAINFRRIVGRAYIERNVVATGSVVGPAGNPQAIRIVNTGSYLIAHNFVDCGWLGGDAEGIGVFSQFAEWPTERAIVVNNDVIMSAPEGTVFGNFSAAIGVYGFADANVMLNNRIRGRARAVLSEPLFPLPPQVPAVPANNAFVLNRFDDFEPSVADVFVDVNVVNTSMVGPGTVEDHGIGTTVVRLPFDQDGCSERWDDSAGANLTRDETEECRRHGQPQGR